jgi:UPF0176 protein
MLTIAALYKFTPFEDPAALKARWRGWPARRGVKGTLCWRARGSTAPSRGRAPGSTRFWRISARCPAAPTGLEGEPRPRAMPFGRLKVRLKREIVTMGQPGTDPNALVGTYVAPADWNALIARRTWR